MQSVVAHDLPPQVPHRGNRLTCWLARFLMRLAGWRIVGAFPNLPQFVLIVAYHTSNWDFLIGLGVMYALGLRASFLGKHVLFKGPLGALLSWLGGVPVDRRAAHGTVGEAIVAFRQRDRFVLAITPEGTRGKVPRWKTGFYHIAVGANVSIVPVAFDYAVREVQIGDSFTPTGDLARDLPLLREFFVGVTAKHPHLAS